MIDLDITATSISDFGSLVQAHWAPIVLHPISGSYERLVVGCIAANRSGFHIEMANALDRLDCFYGERAQSVRFAVELAGKALELDLVERGLAALLEPKSPLSGVTVVEAREVEGGSLQEIAKDWMSVMSSLYQQGPLSSVVEPPETEVLKSSRNKDRLPQLVLAHIAEKDLSVAQHFSDEIVSGKTGKKRRSAHDLEIDFKGHRLVANFATLNASRIGYAVGNIKQRLFDLGVERKNGLSRGIHREHEVIIQVPRSDDPQITEHQYERLEYEYLGLLDHADKVELRLRQFNTAGQIGEHILEKEAA
ncbi:hypothetical protein [Paracoccus benzoatiresistens]|uniref:Uncharacterized protein n=1 Tax=Paracoccus benzoatiresistens TaxID=2997341 RepID=A0ABT4JA62_9RHOB|nr:hypothetical protein [Paracoccus sp. EF6]MCZ0963233.1 hypothetical protein [Paracoccus sp. EF6]